MNRETWPYALPMIAAAVLAAGAAQAAEPALMSGETRAAATR